MLSSHKIIFQSKHKIFFEQFMLNAIIEKKVPAPSIAVLAFLRVLQNCNSFILFTQNANEKAKNCRDKSKKLKTQKKVLPRVLLPARQ